jgi:N-acetylglucosaminyldiphosphoundecaprenol N-acetyl-beta-D-mannosaminyltransferase
VGALDRAGWLEHLAGCVQQGTPHHHVSLNAAKWVAMRQNPALREAVRGATSVAADGAAIVLASRWLGDPLPERVTGCDLAHDLLERAPALGWRVGLLGARPEVLARVEQRLEQSGVHVVFARDGYFGSEQEEALAGQIREAAPQLLLVAMGSPRTELFVARWGARMAVPLVMGVGGTFDVLAGAVRRAPDWVARAHLEWAWRWLGSPRARFHRAVLDSVRFVAAMARGERLDS